MDNDDGAPLPPLPRPLVPTHSRSFSSSSESSAASAPDADATASYPQRRQNSWQQQPQLAPQPNGQLERNDSNFPAAGEWSLKDADTNHLGVDQDAATLDGTSPPLGVLADDQPFNDTFRIGSSPSSAESFMTHASREPGPGYANAFQREAGQASAISAADLDFPRSSVSPSPPTARSRSSEDHSTPRSAHPSSSSPSSSRSFLAQVSPTWSPSTGHSRFASTSAVGLRASPSPRPPSRDAPSFPVASAEASLSREDWLEPGPLPRQLSSNPPVMASGSDARDPLGTGLSPSRSTAQIRRRRAPFGRADGEFDSTGGGANEEDQVVEATRGVSRPYSYAAAEERTTGGSAGAVDDGLLLRRRKYRAKESMTGVSDVINRTPERVVRGGQADGALHARGSSGDVSSPEKQRTAAWPSRSSAATEGVAGQLRRTTTSETLRGVEGRERSSADEFGAVARVPAPGESYPRSRTMSDLLRNRREGGEEGEGDGRGLPRSASSVTPRTYGYRPGSRASAALAAARPSTSQSQYDSPSRVLARDRVRSNDLELNPLPTAGSPAYARRRGESDRASTALGSVADRDRERATYERTRRTSESASVTATRRRAGLPHDFYQASPTEADFGTFGGRDRVREEGGYTQRAATALGSARTGAQDSDFLSEEDEATGSRSFLPSRFSVAPTGTPSRIVARSRSILQTPRDRDAGARRLGGEDDDGASLDMERTPRSGKKTSAESAPLSTGSDRVRRNLYSNSAEAYQTTPNGRSADSGRLTSLSQARSTRRERSAAGSEIGTEAWLAEVEKLRRRSNISRLSNGSTGDAASVATSRGQTLAERERTVRAINDLLRDQGIVAAVASDAIGPASPGLTSSTPRKRESFNGFERGDGHPSSASSRRLAFFRNDADSVSALPHARSLNRDLTRSSSTLSHVAGGRPETALRGLIDRAGPDAAGHHKLLISALDQFDKHFAGAEEVGSPASASSQAYGSPPALELIRRMDGLVSSTTRLNSGLRGLVEAVKADQVQAELADDDAPTRSSLSRFERSVNALLKTSEDQVRCLTEDLVAIVRLDRERSVTYGEERPSSRASTYRSSYGGTAKGSPLQSPPRRAATASPYAGSTVSHASVRSPTTVRQALRDPLQEQTPSPTSSTQSPLQRHTVEYASRAVAARSPLGTSGEARSPADRRESISARSPLAEAHSAYETPSRTSSTRRRSAIGAMTTISPRASQSDLAGLGLPLPQQRPDERAAKTSDSTVRPPSPSQQRTAASPRPASSAAVQPYPEPPPRLPTSSSQDRDLPQLPPPSPANQLHRFPTAGDAGHGVAATRPPLAPPAGTDNPTRGKRSLKLSGGFGAALKNAFSGSRKSSAVGAETATGPGAAASSPAPSTKPVPPPPFSSSPPVPPLPTSGSTTHLPHSASMVNLERTQSRASIASIRTLGDRAERRREVEGILRRAGRS